MLLRPLLLKVRVATRGTFAVIFMVERAEAMVVAKRGEKASAPPMVLPAVAGDMVSPRK